MSDTTAGRSLWCQAPTGERTLVALDEHVSSICSLVVHIKLGAMHAQLAWQSQGPPSDFILFPCVFTACQCLQRWLFPTRLRYGPWESLRCSFQSSMTLDAEHPQAAMPNHGKEDPLPLNLVDVSTRKESAPSLLSRLRGRRSFRPNHDMIILKKTTRKIQQVLCQIMILDAVLSRL